VTPQIITSKDFKQAFDLRKYNLNEIGTDILAFALCVQDHQPKALGICFGTATFAVAINHRQINGVVIAPSIATGVKNLSTVTAMIRINKQDIKLLNSDLGQNTLTAVVGGSYHMFHGFINSLRDYCLKHYHIKQTYLSGGKLKQLNIKTTPHLKIINHAVLCGY
jgi:pantothenate kinase type III